MEQVTSVSADALAKLIEKPGIVFVDFWAKWCAPCKQFAPVFARAALSHPDITFVGIDIEQNSELAEALQIRSIPHLMVFKHGIAIYSESGSLPESALHELAEQAVNVDVSAIQAQLEQEQE